MSKKVRLVAIFAAIAVLACAVLVALISRRPAPGAANDPLRIFPSHCESVVVVPELGRLGDQLARLSRLKLVQLGAGLAGSDAEALAAELVRQLGFDPRSRESMRQAGIDPAGSLAFFSASEGGRMMAIPVADLGKLEELLARTLGPRLEATTRQEIRVDGERIITLSSGAGARAKVAWAWKGSHLVLSTGGAESSDSVASLRAVALKEPASPLSKDARLSEARARLGSSEAYLYLCPGSSKTTALDLAGGMAAGLSMSTAEIQLSFDIPVTESQASLLKTEGEPSGKDLIARLDPNAFLAVRFGADFQRLKPYAEALLPPALLTAARKVDLDLIEEILGNLQPGIAASLTLAPGAQLSRAPELDPRRTNPFDYVFFNAVGRARDAGKALLTLQKIAAIAPQFGARLEEHDSEGAKIFTTRYRLGEGASVALKDGFVLAAGGAGQMELALSRVGAPEKGLQISEPSARKELEAGGSLIFVDVAKLVHAIRELPDSAYGIGGFAVKAAALRWLDAIEEITSLRLASHLAGQSLHAHLALTLKPSAPPPAEKEKASP